MAKVEWFRRTIWTDLDRDEFNTKLNRSRGADRKSQYLRIQAAHLADVDLHAAALELLDRLLAEFPEKGELAMAHLQKGRSLGHLGQAGPAIDEYRKALQAERDYPNVGTPAWLDFGWFVVEQNMTNIYDEVLDVLVEFCSKSSLAFPILAYRYWAVCSIIADFQRDQVSAREFATRALAAACKEHSGFRYHAKLGLVGTQPNWIEMRLRTLAGS